MFPPKDEVGRTGGTTPPGSMSVMVSVETTVDPPGTVCVRVLVMVRVTKTVAERDKSVDVLIIVTPSPLPVEEVGLTGASSATPGIHNISIKQHA